jgi:CBS domain-containing protein
MKTQSPFDRRELPLEFASLCVADVMQRELVTVRAGDSLHEVERVLADAGISGAPVLDDNEQIVGVVSMSDLVARRADAAEVDEARDLDDDGRDLDDYELEAEATEVMAFRRAGVGPCAGDVMTAELAHVPPTACLRDAARTMVERRIHRLLVVERGRVIGLVSTLDLLAALAR